jgi:glycosyltransferase involved in cell wall biosynthesis
MHDVLQSGNREPTAEDQYEAHFTGRFDAVIASCREDASMVRHKNVAVVPNGAEINGNKYTSSPIVPHILFMGPLRIAQNLSGIQDFLERAYPRLRQRIPELQLSILGGRDAIGIAAQLECFRQPGITVLEYVKDPRPFVEACALTINPTRLVRGTCLKVIESIASGRVCVSTRDGARGFLDDEFPGLIIAETVDEFPGRIQHLLLDHAMRRRIEVPPIHALAPYSWKHAARLQSRIYHKFLPAKGSDCC